jgi:hypothetical protein
VRRSTSSILDFGNWSIAAVRQLMVPAAVLVLVRDAGRLSWDALFRGGAFSGSAGRSVAWKSLRDNPINTVGPTAVMLNDFVNYMGHL